MKWIVLNHIYVWNKRSHSFSSTIIEAVGVVDGSGSYSTRVLSDKSEVDNFAKNFF